MRHLLIAAVMVVGALLITATTAGLLQSRATEGNNVSSYEPPALSGPSSKTATAKATGKVEPAIIGVRARPTVTPREGVPAALDKRA